MSPTPEEDLSRDIAAAQQRQAEKQARIDARNRAGEGSSTALGYALRFGVEFVVAIFVGGFMGYWIDHFAGTEPLFLLLMGALGLAAGGRSVYRAYKQINAQALANASLPSEPDTKTET